MKAKLLKEIQLSGISGPSKVGEIIEVRVPDGGNKVYVRSPSTGKEIELIIGTDVELVTDEGITKQKLGSYMFVGSIIILSFIAYKLIKEK